MPTITAPPILIDSVGFSRQFNVQMNPFGLFQVGASNLYQVLQSQLIVDPPIGIFLSSDNGNTWPEQDALHHPHGSGGFVIQGKSCCFVPSTGIISTLYT